MNGPAFWKSLASLLAMLAAYLTGRQHAVAEEEARDEKADAATRERIDNARSFDPADAKSVRKWLHARGKR